MSFVDGWWSGAIPTPANPARLGGPIKPRAIVVHTTDEYPLNHDSQLKQWCESPGEGTCAHFYIGRTAEQGVVQLAPIDRNANHAGGSIVHNGVRVPSHGWWVTPDGAKVHPNDWAVGIELDAAGLLKKNSSGTWLHPDSGRPIDGAEVYLDARSRGWHLITPYQIARLGELLDAIAPELAPMPAGTIVRSNGGHAENGVPWAAPLGPVIVEHATLDPYRKTDAGPQVAAWLLARQQAR